MRAAPGKLLLMAVAMSSWPVFALAQARSDCGYYSYGSGSEGRHCGGNTDAPPPRRVTAICNDETYSYEVGSWACQDHGGVKAWMR